LLNTSRLVARYPIITIEDGMSEGDWDGCTADRALGTKLHWWAMTYSSPTPGSWRRASKNTSQRHPDQVNQIGT
jgi:hypothetical protein